jgi:hypothetical protein
MPVSISFGGAGQYFPFMMGVAHGLRTHFDVDWTQVHMHCFSSGSSGAMALLICNPSQIDQMVWKGITASQSVHIYPIRGYFINIIKSMMPYNAATLLQDHITIGQTKLPFMRPHLVTGPFSNQGKLLEAIYESCLIPFVTGTVASTIDGGFSHKYATCDVNTIVVTLKGESRSDIVYNKSFFFEEILPPSPAKMLEIYEDGKRAIADNLDLIESKIQAGLRDTEPVQSWTTP